MNSRALFKRVAISFFIVISCMANATHVAWDSEHPNSTWLTKESAHFVVNFLSDQKQDAIKVLNIAEQIHSDLVPLFNTEPDSKTHIVLVDDYDYSNGWASPLPYPQIRVIMQPPAQMGDLVAIGEWLPSLIRHEYTHILHMEMGKGKVKGVRQAYGRHPFAFPNAFIPPMLLEGLAVYTETDKNHGYGRLESSLYEMVMRMEVAEDAIKDFSQATGASMKQPLGMHYYYGAYFIDFLAQKYGEEKMMEFFHIQSETITPYLWLNYNARTVFGKSFYYLWSDFKKHLKDKHGSDIASLKKELVAGKVIAESPFKQVMTPSENGLIISKSDGSTKPHLVLVNNSGEVVKKLAASSGVSSLDYSSTYGILAARTNIYKSGVVYSDLYRIVDNSWQRLTHKQRFTNAKWLAQSDKILASRNIGGKSEFWQVAISGNSQALVWQGAEGEVLGDYAVSKDGQFIVAAIKRNYQGWGLEKLNLETKEWTKLLNTKEIEFNPSFMANGDVLFSADYDGVFNIFSLNLQSGATTKLTSELGGAFAPLWQKGIGLVYQGYHHDGYKTKVIPESKLKAVKKVNIDKVRPEYDYPKISPTKVNHSQVSNYSPVNSLMPTTYLPRVYGVDDTLFYGVNVFGQDALNRHLYVLAVDYNPEHDLWAYSYNYSYDNRWALSTGRRIQEVYERDEYVNGQFQKSTKEYRAQTQFNLRRHNLYPVFDDNLTFELGAGLNRLSETSYDTESNSVYFGAAAIWNDQEKLYNIPGKGVGTVAKFVIESNTDFTDKDRFNWGNKDKRYTMQASLSNTMELPYYSALSLDIDSGYTNSSLQPFELGGVFPISRDFIEIFNNKTVDLPGYYFADFEGSKYVKAEASVSTLLSRIDRNLWLWPVGLGDVGSRLFVDSASIWDDGYTPNNFKNSAGVELNTHLKLGYAGRVNIAAGYAKGFDKELGGETFYVNFGRSF